MAAYVDNNLKEDIRRNINNGNYVDAERMVEGLDQNDPDYFYFNAQIFKSKGWSQRARDYARIAIQMDGNNSEYQFFWENLDAPANAYKAQSNNQGYVRGMSCCDFLSCLVCSDCCCEGMGGDIISCC